MAYMCSSVYLDEKKRHHPDLIYRVSFSTFPPSDVSSFLVTFTISYKLRINLISIRETEILGLKSTLNLPADLVNDV